MKQNLRMIVILSRAIILALIANVDSFQVAKGLGVWAVYVGPYYSQLLLLPASE